MKIHRLHRALCAAALALLAPFVAPAQAQQPQQAGNAPASTYRVEVVIFRAASVTGSEDLGAPAEGRGFNGRRDNDGTPPRLVRPLAAEELQLNGVAAQLRNSGSKVLAHAGWVQTATAWGRHAGLSLAELGVQAEGLSGNFYLERGDFLHLGVHLQLAGNPPWTLSELRRIRFAERNYFDHPGFGVIAVVTSNR